MRKPFIAGNWKMNLDKDEAVLLAEAFVKEAASFGEKDVLICPSYPLLYPVYQVIKGSPLMLGAQNIYFEKKGAFTGEVSGEMLLSVGCTFVILGHSERRHVFGENNELINKKMHSSLEQGLKPILCVGELLEERESGTAKEVVRTQIQNGLKGINNAALEAITIAYEPVWAIGTGRTATPQDADNMHSYIREILEEMYGKITAESIRILYGGSVKPENIDGLMVKSNIDGVLVGGASLKADSFLRIIRYEI